MRTTISLDDALARELKHVAAKHNMTVSQFLERAARAELARSGSRGRRRKRFELVTFRGDGPRQGIDLSRPSEVLDALDVAERT